MRLTVQSAAILFVLYFLSVVSASAATSHIEVEKELVAEVFFGYSKTTSRSDFQKAATFIHPDHLRGLREHTLLVLIEARQHRQNKDNPILDLFFEGISVDSAAELTGAEVSARLEYAIAALIPGVLESAHLDNINLMSVDILPEDKAIVRYETRFHGQTKEVVKRFQKSNGKWYLTLDAQPEETAAGLKELLTKPI